MTSTIARSENLDQFTEQLQPGIDSGMNLTDVEYADGEWIGVFNEGRDSTWNYNDSLTGLASQIETRWEQDYELLDVEYGNGIWFATFEEGFSSDSSYIYNPSYDGFTGQIQDKQDGTYRGEDLYDVAYGDGTWFGVMTDNLDSSTYSSSSTANLAAEIDRVQAQDYDLVGAEYTGKGWISVFHEPTGAVESTYTIGNSETQFNQQVNAKLDQGYDLIDIEYGDGIWLGVFDGVITSTGTRDNSTPNNNDVINDSIVQGILLENTHYAFDPDNYF